MQAASAGSRHVESAAQRRPAGWRRGGCPEAGRRPGHGSRAPRLHPSHPQAGAPRCSFREASTGRRRRALTESELKSVSKITSPMRPEMLRWITFARVPMWHSEGLSQEDGGCFGSYFNMKREGSCPTTLNE